MIDLEQNAQKYPAIYKQAYDALKQKIGHRRIHTLIILGSGLADFAHIVQDAVTIDYQDIPGFANTTVAGHIPEMVVGTIEGHPVAVMKGKIFTYEAAGLDGMSVPIRVCRALGAQTLLYSASSGSFHTQWDAGSLVMIQDHINLMWAGPTTGKDEWDAFGPQFIDLNNAYDLGLRQVMSEAAKEQGIDLPEGIYAGVRGPCFETPAEVRMYKNLGADVVGMSVIPEVILALQCGMKVVAVANITNLGVGISTDIVDHHQTLSSAAQTQIKIEKLFPAFLKRL